MENNGKNNNLIGDALEILNFPSLETMKCPPTPRLKVIDLFLEHDKPYTPCRDNNDSIEEEVLLFSGHDYTTSSVDCGESGGLGLGIAVF